jgi:hypothetical protein
LKCKHHAFKFQHKLTFNGPTFRQEGYGDGPMRSCYVLAAQRLFERQTADKIWQDQHGWLVPNLSPSDEGPYSSQRLNEFRLAGAFAAIYLLVMRQPVPKLSSHISLFLLCGSCAPDYDYLKTIHPEGAEALAPWFDYIAQGLSNQPFSGTFRSGDVHHLLAQYLDEEVTHICHHHHTSPISNFALLRFPPLL